MLSRRQLLFATGAGAAALLLPKTRLAADDKPGFTLPPLPYPADALEPHIDAETMTIHHGKHHQAYVDGLNKAIAGTEWAGKPIEEILKNLKQIPKDKQAAVTNNGGGHYNHDFFWKIMAPAGKGGKPSDELAKAIEAYEGGMDKLKKDVNASGLAQFGSGWTWVVVREGKLFVTRTANQGCPITAGSAPVLGIDVWEHAYYLKYKNLRAKYLEAWWNVANWEAISANYAKAMKG